MINPETFIIIATVIFLGVIIFIEVIRCYPPQGRSVYYQQGGWCGLCGKWLENEIVDAQWPYTVCPDWKTKCFNTQSLHRKVSEKQ